MSVKTRTRLRLVAFILLFVFGFSSSPGFFQSQKVVALTPMTAILRDVFNLRSEPKLGNNIVASLPKGQSVTILDMVPGEIAEDYGYFWYRVSATVGGTVRQGYLIRDKDVEIQDYTFENMLSAFPSSYHAALTALHQAHPDWIFTALQTGHDWNHVLNSQQGKNAVWYSYPISQRSPESAAENGYGPSYNPLNDTYAYKDGSQFYYASRQTIAYYLDPRNFLAEPAIFMFENLGFNTSQTVAGIEAILAGTFLSSARTPVVTYVDTKGKTQSTGMTYAEIILDAARYSGASAYFLAARIRMEIGASPSDSVSGTFVYTAPGGAVTDFTGYYNYFNIYASDSPIPGQNIANGLTYAKSGESGNAENRKNFMLPWTDPIRSIMGGAYYIAQNYIRVGQDTLYLQKFSVNPASNMFCWHQYMSSVHAPSGESGSVHTSYGNMGILDNPFEFVIPVFENMPATPPQLSTETRSTNNLLTALSVAGGALSPTFAHASLGTYTVYVDGAYANAVVTGRKASLTSAVRANGALKVEKIAGVRDFSFSVPLAVGDNPISIQIEAENGGKRTYQLSVIRGIPAELNTPDLSSLTIAGQTLTPAFSAAHTGPYSVTVPFGTASLTIAATPQSELATVSGTGRKNLAYGWNTYSILATSPTGVVKTYTVRVNREVPADKDNHILTALSADGIVFDRPFNNADTGPYVAEVRQNLASTTIRATAQSEATAMTGTGAVEIKYGTHDYPVTVRSFSGAARTFILRITRPMPTLDRGGLVLADGGILTGVQPGTTVAQIAKQVKADGSETLVYGSDGKRLPADALVGTGCLVRVKVQNVNLCDDIVVVYGDANKDAKVNAADLTMIRRGILGMYVIEQKKS